MTLPNKLTLFRILLVPVMIIVAFIPYLNNHVIFLNMSIANFINLIIFALASFTDFLDGKIARKYNLITTFGKFADPLADKMLVTSGMVILCKEFIEVSISTPELSWVKWLLPAWAIIIILCRDLVVDGVRLVAAQKNNVIAAGWLGKIKTFVTMVAIVFLFLYQITIGNLYIFAYIGGFLMYVALLFTILSGIQYFWRSRKIILESI